MSPTVALSQLISAIETTGCQALAPDKTLAITVSRLGAPDQKLVAGSIAELSSLPTETFGNPLHAVVLVGKRLHPLEIDFARDFAASDVWANVAKESYNVKE